jgi:hypothetical protein
LIINVITADKDTMAEERTANSENVAAILAKSNLVI